MKLPEPLQKMEDYGIRNLCEAYYTIHVCGEWPEQLGPPPADYEENKLLYRDAIVELIEERVPERTLSLSIHEMDGGCAEDWIGLRYGRGVIRRNALFKVNARIENERRQKKQFVVEMILALVAAMIIIASILTILISA